MDVIDRAPHEQEPGMELRVDSPVDRFTEVLKDNPEAKPIPNEFIPTSDDTFHTYTERTADLVLPPGIYLTDPEVGIEPIPNPNSSPNRFSHPVVKSEIDVRGVTSGNGFFALEMEGSDGLVVPMAFRPFSREVNSTPEEDFTRNFITRFIGMENTQTVGIYKDQEGNGGTISLLDRSLRPADRLATGKLEEGELFGKILQDVARETAYLHAHGVAHGDLTLRNVALGANRAFLIDWGKSQRDPRHVPTLPIEEGTKVHDLIYLRDDFVDFRPSIEDRDQERTSYRKLFMESFFDAYSTWRQEFNTAHGHDGLTHSKQVEAELAIYRELLTKR